MAKKDSNPAKNQYANAITYFSVSANMNDPVLQRLEIIHGDFGISFFVKLNQIIYSGEGYYYQLNAQNNAQNMHGNCTGTGFLLMICRIHRNKKSIVEGIIQTLLDIGYFDKAMFDTFGILTSRAIQENFFYVTRRRKITWNQDFIVQGVSDYIRKVRKIDEEDDPESEKDGYSDLKNTFTYEIEKVQNEQKVESSEIANNFQDFDSKKQFFDDKNSKIVDNVDTRKQSKAKQSESFFSNSSTEEFAHGEPASLPSDSRVGNFRNENDSSSKKPKRKPQTLPEHRSMLLAAITAKAGFPIVANSLDENSSVGKIVKKSIAFLEPHLFAFFREKNASLDDENAKIEFEKFKNTEIFAQNVKNCLQIHFQTVLDPAKWAKMPPTLNSHVDLYTLAKRWDSLTEFVYRKPSEPKQNHVAKQRREYQLETFD